jgi:hypothetical protein
MEVPLLAAIATALVLVGSAVAFGSPPPQPPFPYPPTSPGARIGISIPEVNCARPGMVGLGLTTPRGGEGDLLPMSWVVNDLTALPVSRTRIYLSRRTAATKLWVRFLGPADRSFLKTLDFKRCAVLAVLLPPALIPTVLGVRVNDGGTLTVGLAAPQPSSPPPGHWDGEAIVVVVPAASVAGVQRVYGITQAPLPPPQPPLPGTTTG